MQPVLDRIDYLRQASLTSVIVVADYLRCHLSPLGEWVRPSWMYAGSHDITRTQIGADGT